EEAAEALRGVTLPAPEGGVPDASLGPGEKGAQVKEEKVLGLVLPAHREDLFVIGHKPADLVFALAESLPGKAVTVADLTGWASPRLEPGQSDTVSSAQGEIVVHRFPRTVINAVLLSEVRPPAVIVFPLERAGDALAVCELVFTIREFDGAHYYIAPEFSDPVRIARETGLATVGARDIKSAVPEILARGRSKHVAYPPGKLLARANRKLAAFTGRAFKFRI
ncbi:MAG: hypothetical protein ACUVTQ_11645, partial [Desulfotomaculales bacterium]